MSTITPNKTQGTSLISLQTLATAAAGAGKLASSVLDVSAKLAGTVFVDIGRTATTAFTASTSVDVYIQGAEKGSNNENFRDLARFSTGTLGACSTNALAASGNDAAGAHGDTNQLTLTANAAVDYSQIAVANPPMLLYIRNGTEANSEFHRARFASTASTALYLFEDITLDQNSSNIFGGTPGNEGAMSFVAQLDLTAIGRLRVVVHNRGTGVTVAVQAYVVTFDSLTVA